MKPQVKSKTNWFGFALAVFGGIQMYLPQLQEQISPDVYGRILFTVGVIVVGLRQLTKGPVGG